ncbi:MAG: saccharopine dehydrogenase NADP-binding domain-containing protein [Chloroflexi bacterium]|nr:saccharopine dehydrogenase NADP-binding domain-containing protein [Chloroflexota bacterium]
MADSTSQGFRYAVLGAGRQGTAAAYDLAVRGQTQSVIIGDYDLSIAQAAADRLNRLLAQIAGHATAAVEVTAAQVDAKNHKSLVKFLRGVDSFLSAVPFVFNLGVTRAAIEARASMCDLGGNTDLVREQLRFSREAEAAGISIIPDCGQVPGLGTTLMVYALSLLDEPEGVSMWDGGIPQHPEAPWHYKLTFHLNGLSNEYYGSTMFLRNGQLTEIKCFDPAEYELIEFPEPIGTLEAFATAGGTSTAPWTFLGKLKTYQNKTLRYPGHAAQWKAFSDAGLLELEPIEVNGVRVVPREVLHALIKPKIEAPPDFRDVVLIRTLATGKRQGRNAEAQVDLVDHYDEMTGFTAMERTTGWDGAIVAQMMARGETPRGAVPVELAVDPVKFVAQLRQRGFDLTEEIDAT